MLVLFSNYSLILPTFQKYIGGIQCGLVNTRYIFIILGQKGQKRL